MPDYSKSIIYCIYSTLQNADEKILERQKKI